MSRQPIFLAKIHFNSNISIHFHSFHAGAFFVSPYNEQRKAPLGLRYTPPHSPRKGCESSCLPMCSAKVKTVVAKATRKFSRRYVASLTKSKRSFFQSSFEEENYLNSKNQRHLLFSEYYVNSYTQTSAKTHDHGSRGLPACLVCQIICLHFETVQKLCSTDTHFT